MKECDIFMGSKHILTPPTYLQGVRTPNPTIYAAGRTGSNRNWIVVVTARWRTEPHSRSRGFRESTCRHCSALATVKMSNDWPASFRC